MIKSMSKLQITFCSVGLFPVKVIILQPSGHACTRSVVDDVHVYIIMYMYKVTALRWRLAAEAQFASILSNK